MSYAVRIAVRAAVALLVAGYGDRIPTWALRVGVAVVVALSIATAVTGRDSVAVALAATWAAYMVAIAGGLSGHVRRRLAARADRGCSLCGAPRCRTSHGYL